jgi:hypothetical protein
MRERKVRRRARRRGKREGGGKENFSFTLTTGSLSLIFSSLPRSATACCS